MRRFTLITLIVLFVLLGITAYFQYRAATRGPRNFPGPGFSLPPTPTATTS